MTQDKFVELWQIHALDWYDNCNINLNNTTLCAKEICSLKELEYAEIIYDRYELIKQKVKELYFHSNTESDITLSPFKRAAIIVYAVNSLDPIDFFCNEFGSVKNIYSLFLKQRLAFHLGLKSILMEIPKEKLDELCADGPIFDFNIESIGVGGSTGDSFLKGIYKDIFFSEIYKNYNVITMSNVFLLLVERSSCVKGVFSKLLKNE